MTRREAERSLTPLLSKIRRILGHDALTGRASLRLRLAADAWIDLEAAAEGLHRAESAFGRGDWYGVYGPGRVAQHISVRAFLPGESMPWVDEVRDRLAEIYVRSLELVGRSCVEIGGTEYGTAERCARSLLRSAPYRESGYRLLMDVYAQRGNGAEALLVYDELRTVCARSSGSRPAPRRRRCTAALLG